MSPLHVHQDNLTDRFLCPSSSSSSQEPPQKRHQPASDVPSSSTSTPRLLFLDCFAGSAVLSQAMSRLGFETIADDAASGGTDYLDSTQVAEVWQSWEDWTNKGHKLAFHFAPPCSSFSRARDMNSRTRLRDTSRPEGINPEEEKTAQGNMIALRTAESIRFLVEELGAVGTLENPTGSYLWPFLDQIGSLSSLHRKDILLHQCRFGRPFKKPTTFACFGFTPTSLAKTCSKNTQGFSCGLPWHSPLGFTGHPTAEAAEYPRSLAAAYAGDVRKWWHNLSSAPSS